MSHFINGKEEKLGDGSFLNRPPKGPSEDIKLRWSSTYNGGTKSLRGPNPEWSYTGNRPDGKGGYTSVGLPIHEEGLFIAPDNINRFINSAFEDATSGTPGNPPAQWSPFSADGTQTVTGKSLRITTDAARHFFSRSYTVDAGDTHWFSMDVEIIDSTRIDFMMHAEGGSTGQVETFYLNDTEVLNSFTPNPGTYTIRMKVTNVDAGSYNLRWGLGVLNVTTADVIFSNPNFTTDYVYPYVESERAAVIQIASTQSTLSDNGFFFNINGFRDQTDGVEIWENPEFVSNFTDNGDGSFTSTEGGTAVARIVGGSEYYARYRYKFRIEGYPGTGLVGVSSSFETGGVYVTENGYHVLDTINNGSTNDPKLVSTVGGVTFSEVSVQRLETIEDRPSADLRKCFEGEKDGTETAGADLSDPGWEPSRADVSYTATSLTTASTGTGVAYGPFTVGDRIRITVDSDPTQADFSINSADNKGINLITTRTELATAPGTVTWVVQSAEPYLYLRHGVAGTTNNISFSVQKLTSAICTVGMLTTEGFSSDEMVTNGDYNLMSVNDDQYVTATLFRNNYLDSPRIVRSSDGTNSTILFDSWTRNEEIYRVVQSDGTQFRVGAKVVGRYPSWQWSAWTAFDGSFEPLDYLRLGLYSRGPTWIKNITVWNKVATDEEIERWVN